MHRCEDETAARSPSSGELRSQQTSVTQHCNNAQLQDVPGTLLGSKHQSNTEHKGRQRTPTKEVIQKSKRSKVEVSGDEALVIIAAIPSHLSPQHHTATMMQEKVPSKKLSKAVLELKFMKKSKEKALMQEENEEREQLYHDQLSMLHEGAEKIVMINSYVDCLKFLPCRLSFGGMDQDIEKLNEERLTGLYTVTKPPPKENITEMNADVSAKDMAAQYHPRAHRPTAAHHTQEEQEEGAEDASYDATPNKLSQDQNQPKSGKMRPIFMDGFEGGGRGRGGFRDRGRGFRGGGRGGRGHSGGRGGRGHSGGRGGRGHWGDRGGRDGGFAGGRGREMHIKEEGFWGGKETMKGCLGESTTRGKSMGNKRGHEGSQGHTKDGNTWGQKKFKAERS